MDRGAATRSAENDVRCARLSAHPFGFMVLLIEGGVWRLPLEWRWSLLVRSGIFRLRRAAVERDCTRNGSKMCNFVQNSQNQGGICEEKRAN